MLEKWALQIFAHFGGGMSGQVPIFLDMVSKYSIGRDWIYLTFYLYLYHNHIKLLTKLRVSFFYTDFLGTFLKFNKVL